MTAPEARRRGWILVVDDDADIRELLQMMLAVRGYDVEGAADGREACDRLAARPGAALVLLDLRMPGMDGVEVLGRIRQGLGGPGLPVVVLSGDLGADQLAHRHGVLQTLRKPFELRDLLGVVSQHVEPPGGHDHAGSGAAP